MGIEDVEGIETFFDNYKPDKSSKELILDIVRNEGHRETPLAVLARLYRQSGHQRLSELSDKITATAGNIVPEPSVLKEHLSPVEIKSLYSNSAFVVFGCCIPTLEEAVNEGYYQMNNFWNLYEFSISGSILPVLQRTGKPMNLLSPLQWKAMHETLRSDPTFGSFLETTGFKALPEDLAEILRYVQGNLPDSYDFINKHRYLARAIIN